MYFKQIDEIVNGTKTVTRRVCKPNEIGDRWQVDPTRYFDVHTLHDNESRRRLKWRVGRDYAVQPGRGQPGLWWRYDNHQWELPGDFAPTLAWHPLRIRLLSIRREPLQDITEADAVAEGYPHGNWGDPLMWYREVWVNINGPKSWDATGDVWVLSFEVVR